MFDSVTVREIPADAEAVAGYANGEWPTFALLSRTHPHARRLSIAVNASADADCLDVEPRDATNAEAAAWVRRQQARGVKRPAVYTSVSNARALLTALKRAGVERRDIRLWTAHYTGRPHRCSPLCRFGFWARADATQFTDRSHGRNLDESLCADSFLPSPKPAVSANKHRLRVLRAWILKRHRAGWAWARLKKTANFREFMRRGGK